MATPDDLLRQAAGLDGYGIAGSLGQDRGMASATEAEFDLRTLTPNMLRQKYGDQAAGSMLGSLQRGISERNRDTNTRDARFLGEAIYDTGTGVLSGAVGSVGGLVSLGAGLVHDEAGTAVAKAVQDGMQWAEGTQSDGVNAARRLQRADSALDARDNEAQMKQELASGESQLASELRRWGRDVVDTVGNSMDTVMFTQGTAEATGSLLAGGPIAKGLRSIGAATMAAAGRAGISTTGTAATRVASMGGNAAWPLATAGLEAGGAYSGSANEVMEMSFENLAKNSPMYRELVAEGKSPAEARTEVANRSGLMAAAIQAPIAGLTGTLTRFAETPTRAPSVGAALSNVLVREPTEEAIQSTTGGLAQNIAIQQNADSTRSVSEGVGEQTAQGALYGMSSAGALQGPGMAARGAYQGSRAAIGAAVAAGSTISSAARNRARQVMEAAEQKSTLGTDQIKQSAAAVDSDLTGSLADISNSFNSMDVPQPQKDQATDFVRKVDAAIAFDMGNEAQAMGLPADMIDAMGEVNTRADAVMAAAVQVATAETQQEQMIWAEVLGEFMRPMDGIAESDVQLMDSLPEQQYAQLRAYQQLVGELKSSPVVSRAMQQQVEIAKKLATLTEEQAATPEGMTNVNTTVAAAKQAPTEGNAANISAILDHANNGRIELTPDARRALNISLTMLAAQDRLQQAKAQYGLNPRDVVSENVLTGRDPAYADHKSAIQHITEIRRAVDGGNISLARGLLDNFGSFVDHMGRKVDAINEHFDTFGRKGRPRYIAYDAYNPKTGETYRSDANGQAKYKGEFVEPTNATSVEYAQNLNAEYQSLAEIFNGLVQAIPELNVRPTTPTALNPQLIGKPADIVARFQPQPKPAPAAKPEPVKQAVQETKPAPVVEAEPTVVEADPVVEAPAVSTPVEATPAATNEAPAREAQDPTPTVAERRERNRVRNDEVKQAAIANAPDVVVDPNNSNTETAKRFPNLITTVRNYFTQLFDTPKTARTRVRGDANPIATLQDALDDLQGFGVVSRLPVNNDTIREYKDLLQYNRGVVAAAEAVAGGQKRPTEKQFALLATVKGVAQVMQQNLINELAVTPKNRKKTQGQSLLDGEAINRVTRLKNLNIVEQNEDGSLQYNNELIEMAALAGFQWALTMGVTPPVRDSEMVETLTAVSEESQGNLAYELSQGFTTNEIADGLVPMVKRYWDVRDRRNDDDGYADPAYMDGIPTSVAMEVVRAMRDIGLIQTSEVTYYDSNLDTDRTIPLHRSIIAENIGEPVRANPTLIEELVMKKPEFSVYFDNERPNVPDIKMNTQGVENTKEDKATIKAANETKYSLNTENFELFTQLDRETIEVVFGGGYTTAQVKATDSEINVNHAKAIAGRNAGIAAGWQAARDLHAQLTGVAGARDIGDVAIHFAHNMSTVNRLQQLGNQTPQGNKLLREMVLPTTATVDLVNDQRKKVLFDLAVAQALEIKIHRMSPDQSAKAAQDLLTGSLAPAVTAMENWLKDRSAPVDHAAVVDALKAAGKDVTPLAFHALKEVARFNLASEAERAKFTTALYIEADGVTNGVAMASLLMATGRFDGQQIQNLSKAGISFGQARSMADLWQNDQVDLYGDSAANAQERAISQIKRIRRQKNSAEIMEAHNAVMYLVEQLLPGVSLSQDVNGDLIPEFDRSIAKNPMTVTLYGSSPSGIANKLAGMLTDALYERATDGDVSTEVQQLLNMLMNNRVGYNKKDDRFYVSDDSVGNIDFSDLKTLTINGKQFKQLQSNIQNVMVTPLREGIEQTLGESMMKSTTLLRQGMQVQSIFFEQLYKQRYNEAIEYRKANDPSFRRGDGLSETDTAKILEELADVAPWFKTANQNLLVNKFRYMDSKKSYGRSMDETLRPMAKVMSPVNSGVAAIPYLNIGVGDGQTIQRAWASGQQVVTRTLPVFDGVNASLNDIDELSQLMNKSVRDAGMTNPHLAAMTSFNQFLKDSNMRALVETLTADPEANKAVLSQLDFALGLPQESYLDMEAADYLAYFDSISLDLRRKTLSVEARHRAMQKVGMSYDQFAAVGRPFVTEGVDVSGMDNDAIARVLTSEYLKQIDALKEALQPRKLEPEVAAAAVEDTTHGVQILTPVAIEQLTKGAALSKPQSDLLRAILPSVADYSILAGTPDQLNSYLSSLGQVPIEFVREDGAVRHGQTDTGLKQVLLATDSTETMLHELVHAATFEVVQKHYNGEQISKEATNAIYRMEGLMEQFMGMRAVSSMSPEQITAMGDAKLEISNALRNDNRTDATNKAVALNEFMAWTTANADLAERLSKIKANPISRLINDVLSAIKSLLGLPKADMLSNVVFNTAIIAQERQSLTGLVASVTMDHAVRGADADLIQLRNKLNRNILAYVDSLPEGQLLRPMMRVWDPMVLGKDVAADFRNVFNLSPVQASTLEMVVATLATNMNLDATALGQAQTLYQQTLSKLSVDSFTDPNAADPAADRYYAQQKFDMVTGKTGRRTDKQGRSTLMGTFLGMAMVSPEFRDVLSKIEVPTVADQRDGTFDASVMYHAENQLNNLGRLVAGQGKSKSIDEALGSLSDHIFASVSEEQGLLGSAQSKVDRANEWVVEGLTRLSNAGDALAERLEGSNNRAVQVAGGVLGVASGMLTQEGADAQSEVITSWANKLKVPATVSRLISDVVGRTNSNADLYDRIKLLRSTIQQLRQHFRNDVPLELISKFKTKPLDSDWTAMFNGLAKTDVAALQGLGQRSDLAKYVGDAKFRQATIAAMEGSLQQRDPNNFSLYQTKMKQLANYMVTGVAGPNLLSNAEAISRLFNMSRKSGWKNPTADMVREIDQLTSLYALDQQPKDTIDRLARLFKDEADGVSTVIDYMTSNRSDELKKVRNSMARFNYIKGYVPSNSETGKSLRIVENANAAEMAALGYTHVGNYGGSQLDTFGKSKGYFFSTLGGKAAVAQGIMQNIHRTAAGVDPVTGFSNGLTAGRITSRASVQQISGRVNNDRGGAESLKPVFDMKGKVIAYERMIDPKIAARLNPSTELHNMLGVWRGRQVEESMALEANMETLKVIDQMYRDTVSTEPSRKKEFVNLMNKSGLDPVIRDMVDLFSFDTNEFIKDELNGELWVRRDMLEDVTGYRNASVGDFWSGVSRWSPAVQQTVKDLAISTFGINAYKNLVKLEQIVQGLAADARTLIVIKSGLIPMLNFMSNVYHLLSVGVPIGDIVKNVPRKLVELRAYNKGVTRRIQIEVENRANRNNPAQLARLRAEMRSINDSFKRLSIWPLIEAGEFSTVADIGDQADNLELSSGRVGQWLDKQVDKLPSFARTPAKYALVSKDTALFQGLQKSVQYGDFIAKAVMFDHHTRNKKMDPKESIGIITDEFVNYDRLPGRMRGGLENFGLLWFYNFKLRMVKVAASTLRNRPVFTLLTSFLPTYPGAEMPIGDSIVSKLADNTLGYSIGPEMGWRAPTLNPWWNLAN